MPGLAPSRRPAPLGIGEIATMVVLASVPVVSAICGLWPIEIDEALGFTTGGACVWLVVREHWANWPIGIANNVFFLALFFRSRLYADTGLQAVYVALGAWGWAHWRRHGTESIPAPISRVRSHEWIAIAATFPVVTLGLRTILTEVNGAAPWPDAITTALSLTAQVLLCRKRLENWWFWIAADLIYIPMYVARGLSLTALLYVVFLVLCVIGLRTWRAGLERRAEAAR